MLGRRLRRDGRRRRVVVGREGRRRGAAIDGGGRVVLLVVVRMGVRVGSRDGRRRVLASPRVHDDAERSPCGQGEEAELQSQEQAGEQTCRLAGAGAPGKMREGSRQGGSEDGGPRGCMT